MWPPCSPLLALLAASVSPRRPIHERQVVPRPLPMPTGQIGGQILALIFMKADDRLVLRAQRSRNRMFSSRPSPG